MGDSPQQKRRRLSDGMTAKILGFVTAVTVSACLLVSGMAIYTGYVELIGGLERELRGARERAASGIEAALTEGRAELTAVAEKSGASSRKQLERQLAGSRYFDGLATLRGEKVVAVGQTLSHPLDPKVLKTLLASGFAALPEGVGGQALIAAVRAGEALLIGVYTPALLEALLAAERPFGQGSVLLLDRRGAPVASGNPTAPFSPDTLLGLTSRSDQSVRTIYDATGEELRASARALSADGFHVVSTVPTRVAFDPLIAAATRILTVDLIVVLLVALLAYRTTSVMLKPIRTLAAGARRATEMDFDVEIPELGQNHEIGVLTHAFNDMMRRLRGYQNDIEAKNRALEEQNEELQRAKETFEQLSITDGLTKLHNHRFFQDHLTREIKRVARTGSALSMLLFDLDDFKQLNDRLGHAAGDELLMRIARVMEGSVRDSDLLARYGGEEFAVVASDTDLHGAYKLAEKIRMAIAEASFILDDSLRPHRATVSIGVAQYHDNRRKFFQDTDRALYRAKDAGKNCVEMAEEEAQEPLRTS